MTDDKPAVWIEPADCATVSWGTPLMHVFVRHDNWVLPGDDEHWFSIQDYDDEPLCWQALCKAMRRFGQPWLLERTAPLAHITDAIAKPMAARSGDWGAR